MNNLTTLLTGSPLPPSCPLSPLMPGGPCSPETPGTVISLCKNNCSLLRRLEKIINENFQSLIGLILNQN